MAHSHEGRAGLGILGRHHTSPPGERPPVPNSVYTSPIMKSQAINPRPTKLCVAQLVERVLWEHEAAGSIPVTQTNSRY